MCLVIKYFIQRGSSSGGRGVGTRCVDGWRGHCRINWKLLLLFMCAVFHVTTRICTGWFFFITIYISANVYIFCLNLFIYIYFFFVVESCSHISFYFFIIVPYICYNYIDFCFCVFLTATYGFNYKFFNNVFWHVLIFIICWIFFEYKLFKFETWWSGVVLWLILRIYNSLEDT